MAIPRNLANFATQLDVSGFKLGSAGTPSITFTGDTNTGIFSPTADTIAFTEGGAEAMRIDSSGRLLVGTTTARSDFFNTTTVVPRFQVELAASDNLNRFISVTSNNSDTGGGTLLLAKSRGTTVGAVTIVQNDDQIGSVSFQAADGVNLVEAARIEAKVDGTPGSDDMPASLRFYTTADGAASSTERMRITSAGDYLFLGGTLRIKDSGNTSQYAALYADSSVFHVNAGVVNLAFYTGGGEKARINESGYFKASADGTYNSSTGSYHELRAITGDTNLAILTHTAASPYGPLIKFTAATPNNTTNYFLECSDTTNTKCYIYSSGTVTNRTGTYNAISDVKLKQDIVDAGSQWDDIKNLRVRKFRLKDEVAADPNYPAYIGLVAQEAELVSPGLIDACPDFEGVTKTREVEKIREVEVTPAVLDEEGNVVEPAVTTTETYTETEEYTERVATGTVTKSIKYSILYMKAVKALQEAMTRIETLEAQNAVFEARLAALESK